MNEEHHGGAPNSPRYFNNKGYNPIQTFVLNKEISSITTILKQNAKMYKNKPFNYAQLKLYLIFKVLNKNICTEGEEMNAL